MPLLPRLLLSAAIVLAAVGVGVAVAQPGNLGGSDEGAAPPAVAAPEPTRPDAPTTAPAAPTTAPEDADVVEGAPSPGGGSGLTGGSTAPRDLEDGLAATGGTSLLAVAVVSAGAGLALRHRRA